ncbi:delta subunit of the central stalk of mitochondrial F1F0 ATP synthase, atp16 [Lecanora helva]
MTLDTVNLQIHRRVRSIPTRQLFLLCEELGLILAVIGSVQVNIPAESGEMGVLASHVPSIEQLKPGLVEVIEESGGSKQFFLSGGFAIVQPGSQLSINAVEGFPLEDFSADAVRSQIGEAQKIAGGSGSEQDIAEAKIELEKMKNWPPNSPNLSKSTGRKHAPICKPTDPIVQEGFVATRIRILQDLQAQALAGKQSHSSMVPCPPNRARRYEPESSPKHTSEYIPAIDNKVPYHPTKPDQSWGGKLLQKMEHDEKASLVNNHASAASQLLSPDVQDQVSKPEFIGQSPVSRVQDIDQEVDIGGTSKGTGFHKARSLPVQSAPKFQKITAETPRNEEGNRSDQEILSPRPISASLADSSRFSECFQRSSPEYRDHAFDDERNQTDRLPRKSVADKLGFLVEHESCNGTALSQGDDGPPVTSVISATVHPYEGGTGEPIQPTENEQELSKPLLHGKRPCSERDSASPHRASVEYGSLPSDHSELDPALLSQAPEHNGLQPPVRGERRSLMDQYTAKNSESFTITDQRVSSSSQVYPDQDSNIEAIELGVFTNEEADADRHGKKGTNVGSVSSNPSAESRSSEEQSTIRKKGHKKPSTSASVGGSSRRSSIGRFKSSRAASRSTSWFRKSWFNPFSGGTGSVTEDAFVESPSVDSTPRTIDDVYQSVSPNSGQPLCASARSHSVDDSNHEKRTTILTVGATVMPAQKDHTNKESHAGTSHRIPISDRAQGNQHLSQTLKSTQESSLSFRLPAVDREELAELQEISSPKYAKSSSGSSRMSGNSRKPSIPERQSSKRAPTSPSKAASLGQSSRSRAGSVQQHPQVDCGQQRLKLRGRGIKKIQVIITFDGSDDFVIEAGTKDD